MRGIRLCPSHCSRLSHCLKSPRRTTQKAHAWHISFPYVGSRRYTRMVHIRQLTAGYNIPTVSIHRCLAFLTILVICEITSSQRQASDKRSFHKSSIHPHYPYYRLSASKMPCKGNTIILIIYYNKS